MTCTQTYKAGPGHIQIGDQEPIKCKSIDITVTVVSIEHGASDPAISPDREVHVKAEPA